MMQSGWGKAVLILVGLGLAAVGGYHVYKGASKKFLKDLRVSGGTGITAVGVTGYVAKGVVLAGAGLLVIVATLQADPSKATGFDAAVKTLGHAPSARSYSSWPLLVSRPSARIASCAAAAAALAATSARLTGTAPGRAQRSASAESRGRSRAHVDHRRRDAA